MSSSKSPDEILDTAVQSMLTEAGPDEPPPAVIEQLRQQIAERTANRVSESVPNRLWQQVAWGQLVACSVAMATCAWIVGEHKALFSHVAARQISAEGTITLYYTDGRMKVIAGDDS